MSNERVNQILSEERGIKEQTYFELLYVSMLGIKEQTYFELLYVSAFRS